MRPFTGLRIHHFVDVWICTLTIECNQHMMIDPIFAVV